MMQRPIARLASSLPSLSVHHQLCRLSSQPFCRLSSSRLTFANLQLAIPHITHSSSSSRFFHSSRPTQRSADPYSVLGVSRTASKDEIKLAYYKLAKEHHPDTNSTTSNSSTADNKNRADRFHRIQAAYETLSDPNKKAMYDRGGGGGGGFGGAGGDEAGSTGMGAEEWNSWYEEMSKAGRTGSTSSGAGRRGGRSWMEFDADEFIHDLFGSWKGYGARNSSTQLRRTKGADLQSDMTLSFLDAVHGTTKSIAYSVDDSCTTCNATGKQPGGKKKHCSACQGKGYKVMGLDRGIRARVECEECGGEGRLWPLCSGCSGSGVVKEQRQVEVKIPAGVTESTNVRLLGMGDAGKRGGKRGNLRIRVHIADDTQGRRRDGCDIHSDLNLSLPQAILGLDANVQTVHGQDKLHVPSGVQHGAVIRVKGRGVKALNGSSGEVGDHVVHVRVRIPGQSDMSGEQVEMMRQWAVAQQAQKDEEDRATARRADREQKAQQQQQQQAKPDTDDVEQLETMKHRDPTNKQQSRRKGVGKSSKMRKPRSRAVWQDEPWDDEDDEAADEDEVDEWDVDEDEDGEEDGSEVRGKSKRQRRQRSRS